MRTRSLALSVVLSLLPACAASPGPAPAPPAGDAPPAASAAPASAPPAASDGIDLEKRAEEGFSILLPKGAKQFHKAVTGGLKQLDYAYPLDAQNMNAIEVHVALGENAGETSLDAAVRTATMAGGEVDTKKEVATGKFLVVKKPEGSSRWVLFSVKGGEVKCDGPVKYVATLTAICASFEVH